MNWFAIRRARVAGEARSPSVSAVLPTDAPGYRVEFALREIELILAEKRTALSLLRTGIAVFALPLSVLSVLIATSRWYDALHVVGLLAAVLVICAALTALGAFLVVRAVRRVHSYDLKIAAIKERYEPLAKLLE